MNPSFRNKNTTILFLMALLFFAGHYYIYTTPIGMSREICMISSAALLCLCLFGSVFLLSDPRRVRSQNIFAGQMFLVALAAGISLATVIVQPESVPGSLQFISPGMLIYGNVYAFILLLYPFEVVCLRPMRWGNYFRLFLPALLAGLFFYGYIGLTQWRVTPLESWQDLVANFHRFDVWFRLVILVYPIWLFIRIVRQKKQYVARCRSEFSNEGCIGPCWLNYYLFGYFLILVSYMIVILLHNPQSLFMHRFCFLLLFGFSFYHILRQEPPVLFEFPNKNGLGADLNAESQCGSGPTDSAASGAMEDKYRFVDKISHYKADLERWMETQEPYRDKNFKLLDVMQILPLNRSYISRLFNEGYGETFFDFVMRYRINKSIYLLEHQPDMNIRCVSERCGFSSPSVFGRAFLRVKGVTPKQYRRDVDAEI